MYEFKDFIGNEYIRGFLQGAVRKGLNPHAILQKAGIPPQAYEDPQASIDGIQLQSLIQATKEVTNDIYLGILEYPAKLPMELEVTKRGMQSETLGEALTAMGQFAENYRNDYSYDYTLDKKSHEFCLGSTFKVAEGMDSHFLHFYRLSSAYKFLSWLIGSRIKLTRMCFPEPRPEYCYDYRRLFHCDIEFNQPKCQFCFERKYLGVPIIRKEAELIEYANRYSDWFEIPGRECSITSQVEQVLRERQEENCFSPPIEVVAETLAINPRTLRRALARENESYQKIKYRLRCDLAIKLLLTTEIPIAAVAEKLGFLEPSDFTRSFQRWTGSTPSAYRAVHARDKDMIIRSYKPGTA